MTLRVSGKNLDIGEALRQHVVEKVEATVARYFSGSVGGHVVMTREGSGYRSDCTLRLSSGISLHAEEIEPIPVNLRSHGPVSTLFGHSASHSERLFLPLSGPCSDAACRSARR